jgi:drug/metabolite transporter (DMT)-like permease
MSHAIKRGIWLVGFALMLVQFGLQATALRFGELSVVQPVLTTELLFLLLILAVWFRYRLGAREWLGALLVVGGLGGFFLAARPHGGQLLPSTSQWVVASAILISAIAACIAAGMRGPRWWRAAAFGAATAVTAAFGASLTKAITGYVSQGWGHVFTHFQPYMLAVTGLGTVFLLQNALHRHRCHPLRRRPAGRRPVGRPRARRPGRTGGRRRGAHPLTPRGRLGRRGRVRRDARRCPRTGHGRATDRGAALSRRAWP